MKKAVCLILILALCSSLVGCKSSKSFINGVNLEEYSIVYSDEDYGYSKRAAEYIKTQILERTELNLPLVEDSAKPVSEYEIVVGNTDRDISKRLDADTKGLEFAILCEEKQIALEGDYFVIAAAAYFFIETCVPGDDYNATLPSGVSVHQPITKKATNYILLIGDGMGTYQTKIFEYMENNVEFGDGEDLFYGYMLPYMGSSRTDSLSGTTDSAAGGTALACGIKTVNGNIGKDAELNDVMSLTELALSLGMSAGVMSTEVDSGATPAAFSAHADSRNDKADILNSQMKLYEKYDVLIDCGYNYLNAENVEDIAIKVSDSLAQLSKNDKGFFLMYEEAYIDKQCHSNNINGLIQTVVRFNAVIGRVMEYAFYNPDTFVLITADHETGDLYPEEDGTLAFHHDDHTSADVPIFAYGDGGELFDGQNVENIQIAHTIASFMGVYDFGDQSQYSYLKK